MKIFDRDYVRNSVVSFCFFASLLTGIVILFDTARPEHYKWLPLLPFGYAILDILLLCLKRWRLYQLIVIALYFVRDVFTPFIMRFGNYTGYFKMLTKENVFQAVVIMLYETCIVFAVLVFLDRSRNLEIVWKKQKHAINIRTFIFLVLALEVILAFVMVPTLRVTYHSIFEVGGNELTVEEIFNVGTLSRIVYTLTAVIIPIAEIGVSAIWIKWCSKMRIWRGFSILLSCLVFLMPVSLMDGSDGWTLIVLLVYALVLIKQYQIKLKYVLGIGVIGGCCLVIVLVQKMAGFTVLQSKGISDQLSLMFQAYFPGVCNVAGIFNVYNIDKLQALFYDIYYMIPFRNTLFRIPGDMRLVILYTQQNKALSSILPTIGEGYVYLGFMLSPLLSILFILIADKYEKKREKETDLFKYELYTFILIYAAVSPVMYNWVIFGARYIVTFLPLLILSALLGNARK